MRARGFKVIMSVTLLVANDFAIANCYYALAKLIYDVLIDFYVY
jgi:hypothetical protein